MVKYLFLATVLLLINQAVTAQKVDNVNTSRKTLSAVYTNEIIKIDGVLDEKAWGTAFVAKDFVQIDPDQDKPARFATVVKVLYDKDNLYFGVICYDPLGKKGVRVKDLKRDFDVANNDVFGIGIDAFNDKRNNITFATNPYGAQKDYLSFDAQLYDDNWNGLWQVHTKITDSGWVAEFAIPWKTLRYKQAASAQSWGINFYRQRRFSNEVSAWSPYPRAFSFNRMDFAGQVTDLNPPKPSSNIQVNPYTLPSYDKTSDLAASASHFKVKAGGEFKWAVNPNSILSGTVNTDFAQADADLEVNNLTRFSVLFPEHRQFFLENASLFSPGLNGITSNTGSMNIYPFFSRTIGLSETGGPLPIDGGARFVHLSPNTNYGAMAIRQGAFDGTPQTYFAVARFSENLSGKDRIGGLITMKSVAGTGQSNGYTNVAGSIDGLFRFDDRNFLNTMLINSYDGKDDHKGMAGYFQYQYQTNPISVYLAESVVTKNYENETGFVSRTDVISTSPGFITNLRGDWLPFKKLIRAFQPDATAEFYHQASTGKFIESSVVIYPFWVLFHSGGFFGYSITPNYQYLQEQFSPLGINIEKGEYKYARSSFYAGSDPSKVLSYTIQYDIGPYFNGHLNTLTTAISYTPIPHIALSGALTRNQFIKVGIAETSTTVSLYNLQGVFSLNPRLQLNSIVQYNTQNKSTVFNMRLSWEFKSLSYVYVIFNQGNFSSLQGQALQNGIFKVSYLKQF